MRRASVIIGLAQAVALLVFGVSVVVNAQRVHSTVGQPSVMAIIFSLFAGALAKLATDLKRNRAYARTPFALMQVFAGIVGYTVMVGSSVIDHVVGGIVLVSSVIGLAGLKGRR
jgi:hypothetical protein